MHFSSKIRSPDGHPAPSSVSRRFFGPSRRAFVQGPYASEPASSALVGGEIEALDRALDADPESARTHARMGAMHERRGQVHAAYRWYRQALSLDPGCTLALDGIRRYCRLMGLDEGNPRLNPAAARREADA